MLYDELVNYTAFPIYLLWNSSHDDIIDSFLMFSSLPSSVDAEAVVGKTLLSLGVMALDASIRSGNSYVQFTDPCLQLFFVIIHSMFPLDIHFTP